MWEQLDDLDQGCRGGGGRNSSDLFARSGVAIATTLNDGKSRVINTGWKVSDTCDDKEEEIDYNIHRRRRSIDVDAMYVDWTESECCNAGTQDDTTRDRSVCAELVNHYIMGPILEGSQEYTSQCIDIIRACCTNTTTMPDEDGNDGTYKLNSCSEEDSY